MSKLIAVVSAAATTMTLANITAPTGQVLQTVVLRADDAAVSPVMVPVMLRPEKVEELKQKLASNPMMATILVGGMVHAKGVGVLNDSVQVEYISDAFPIVPMEADGYEQHNLTTGETTVKKPTLH